MLVEVLSSRSLRRELRDFYKLGQRLRTRQNQEILIPERSLLDIQGRRIHGYNFHMTRS